MDLKGDIEIKVYPRGKNPSTWLSNTGHVVLKTLPYEDEALGIYVSFWPGKNYCTNDEKGRELCSMSTSHFHDKDQDDLIYFKELKNKYKCVIKNVNLLGDSYVSRRSVPKTLTDIKFMYIIMPRTLSLGG